MKSYVLNNWPRLLIAVLAAVAFGAGIIPDHAVAGAVITMPGFDPIAVGGLATIAFLGDTIDQGKLKEIIENQGKAWDEFKKANEALLKAKAEGKALGDLEAKVATLSAELDKVADLKASVDAAIASMQRPSAAEVEGKAALELEVKGFNLSRRADAQSKGSSVSGDISVEAYVHYKSGFFKLVRNGNMESLSADERKAMIAGGDADGGYLLPQATQGKMVTKLFEQSIMRQLATIQPISGPVLEGIIDNNEADAGWVAETGTRSDTATPQVGKYRIEAFEMYAMPKVSQTLIDDAAVNVEDWLTGKVADKFGRVEGLAFWQGNGVGQARGLASGYTLAATADATRAWGQFEKVKTGANGDFHTTQFDPVVNLIGAFKEHFLQNAQFCMRRAVRTKARLLKESTTNRYLWEPGMQQGAPEKLMGYPVRVDEYMPTLATGSASLAFGDFKQAYTIVDRIGVRTLRDPYTAKPYILFYSTKRTGGGAVNFEAVKFITFEA